MGLHMGPYPIDAAILPCHVCTLVQTGHTSYLLYLLLNTETIKDHKSYLNKRKHDWENETAKKTRRNIGVPFPDRNY